MKKRPVASVNMEALKQLVGNDSKAERLLSLWNCSPDIETFKSRALSDGYTGSVIHQFLDPNNPVNW